MDPGQKLSDETLRVFSGLKMWHCCIHMRNVWSMVDLISSLKDLLWLVPSLKPCICF